MKFTDKLVGFFYIKYYYFGILPSIQHKKCYIYFTNGGYIAKPYKTIHKHYTSLETTLCYNKDVCYIKKSTESKLTNSCMIA